MSDAGYGSAPSRAIILKTGRRAWRRAILALFAAAAALGSCALPDIRVDTPDLAGLADGSYRGSYDGGMVKAEVEVDVAGGAITAIRILRHECGTGRPAEAIVDEVVARQSLEVDAVSGSTYSSRVILKAIELALSRAI